MYHHFDVLVLFSHPALEALWGLSVGHFSGGPNRPFSIQAT